MTTFKRAVVLFAVTISATAFAQDNYPNKPIRLVVPFPPGGGTDIIARDVANKVSTTLGWDFVVENKPGSGGNLGVDAAAKARPDGYTLALGQTSNLSVNPTLYSNLPYDSVKGLTAISLVASAPLVLVVASDSPMKTWEDVVKTAKAQPGKLNFASPGNGTVAHLTSELLQKTADIKFTHIPYKGAAQAVTDLIGGRVDLYASSVPTLLGSIKNGKLRAIAVTSKERVADMPDVPTVAESGYKGFESTTWFGFVGPAGIPKPIVEKLNAEINKSLASDDLKVKLREQGAQVLGGSPEQFSALIKEEIDRWATIIKDSGTKIE
ncbi:Bug family tripartite tricarboxylate transporter substrate binding protein [Advenella mimigardefordensis]|uniref:Putative Bug-like extracytoplasmic solute binding receptor, TTT family n=1 Tax=Advenella mimigardefordensis (strain DSM 17166 / LMG 22922 / DPN7) TaxID=1247726 RepID=W0P9N6_ADVMD|nr:tripartite tricarboxylate transporter substrate binding protein [Advenella mimigardefordensis]AHG62135.1 putative Bug-like extracytoplasmic solute binding receptor, TTT family [Advenella mimigardefordensis DPN7]